MAAPAKAKPGAAKAAPAPKGGQPSWFERMNEKKIEISDVAIFSRQFSTMINAGLPVLQCLAIIAEQQQNPKFKRVINQIKDDIGSGGNLSDAMAKHPTVFDELYCNMIKSGELGGVLDAILDRLSIYMEKAEALRRKIKSAMMYPSIVLSVAGIVVGFLLVKVLPQFQETFASFGSKLPPLTQGLIDLSNWAQKWWPIILAVVVGGKYGIGLYGKTAAGAYQLDQLALKVPVFGDIQKKSAVAKFARTLGTLLKSGVPILEALETVAKTAGNKVIEEIINGARASIREGQGMTEPLRKGGIFPPMVIQMVSVGEETGKIDEMLTRAADFYEEEVDTAVEGMSAAMEPLIIVFLGVTIGTIVIAMFMPMFSMGEMVGS